MTIATLAFAGPPAKRFAFVTTTLRRLTTTLGLVIATLLTGSAPTWAAEQGDNYPWAGQGGGANTTSTWSINGTITNPETGYYYRNCTDFVAWRLRHANGFTGLPGGIGNAATWGSWAKDPGHNYPVNDTPAVGAVAWFSDSNWGHVAWVAAVNADGTVLTENYNSTYKYGGKTYYTGKYYTTVLKRGTDWPAGFIHFRDIEATAASGGIATLATSDGHIQMFTVAGSTLRQNWYAPADGTRGTWTTTVALPATALGTPALAARPGTSVIDAFVRGSDGNIYQTWYDWGTGGRGGWISMGGPGGASDPAVARTADGHVQILTTSAGAVRQNWFDPPSGAIGRWVSTVALPATALGTPALAARPGTSVIDAFVRGSDGNIYQTWYDWGTGVAVAGSPWEDPAAPAILPSPGPPMVTYKS
ncbi:MAG: CHAP domain-containing protein [Actinomycetales bacterium]|nr:CHAP domain-containing protein [Candidatus Phosphoribacter baldrii]